VEPAIAAGQKSLAGRAPTPEPTPIQGLKETPPTAAAQPLPTAPGDPARASQTAPDKKSEPAPAATPEGKAKSLAAVPSPAKPAKPAAPEARPVVGAAAAEAQKPTAVPGQKLYSVQVATFKDKRSAEELKKTLQKKGFEVVMKTTGDPKQGQSFTLQLQPVDSMGKASTMMEQVKYVPQAKPSIVTVQPGN